MVQDYPNLHNEYERQVALFTSTVQRIQGKWKRVECDEWHKYKAKFGRGLIYCKTYFSLGALDFPLFETDFIHLFRYRGGWKHQLDIFQHF